MQFLKPLPSEVWSKVARYGDLNLEHLYSCTASQLPGCRDAFLAHNLPQVACNARHVGSMQHVREQVLQLARGITAYKVVHKTTDCISRAGATPNPKVEFACSMPLCPAQHASPPFHTQ